MYFLLTQPIGIASNGNYSWVADDRERTKFSALLTSVVKSHHDTSSTKERPGWSYGYDLKAPFEV